LAATSPARNRSANGGKGCHGPCNEKLKIIAASEGVLLNAYVAIVLAENVSRATS
jgi:hypothetical protein